jgi:acetyl-CoA C-acetyltransferase
MVRLLEARIVIVSAARTPVGRFDGILARHDAVELGAHAIRAAVQNAGLNPAQVDTVSMGIVVSCGYGEAPAKEAALRAGLPETVHARAMESVCGSALDAICVTSEMVLCGAAHIAVAGGMESRSNAPYLLGPRFWKKAGPYGPGMRVKVKRAGAYRFAFGEDVELQLSGVEIKDATAHDGLFWAREKKFMREYALAFAKRMGYSVEQVNELAADSHRKAWQTTESGAFADEIAPVGDVSRDELMSEEDQRRVIEEKPDDIASAFNTSVPADGGAAVVLATAQTARELGLPVMARVLGYARLDGAAADFLGRPVDAVAELRGALEQSGDKEPFEIIEANEAFGVQLPLFFEAFGPMQINVHGGAIALGHPFGAAGARILTTLLHAMKRYGHRRGIATICFGSGGAYAIAVERNV